MANVKISVKESNTRVPVVNADVLLNGTSIGATDEQGILFYQLGDGSHNLEARAFNVTSSPPTAITVPAQTTAEILLNLGAKCLAYADDTKGSSIEYCTQGQVIVLEGSLGGVAAYEGSRFTYRWTLSGGELLELDDKRDQPTVHWDTNDIQGPSQATIRITDASGTGASISPSVKVNIRRASVVERADSLPVSMRRAAPGLTPDQFLWPAIRNRTRAIRFDNFSDFVDKVLCDEDVESAGATNTASMKRQQGELYSPAHGVGSYELLKTAAQTFLLLECGVHLRERDRYNESRVLYDADTESNRLGKAVDFAEAQQRLRNYLGGVNLPYIDRVLRTAFSGYAPVDSVFCNGYLADRAGCPVLIELIWSYWHEEAMLVQAMNALSLRFQNRRNGNGRDPLAHLEIAPLYPINNLLFGHIQDELFRTSVKRRAFEYDHHYGIRPIGKAVGEFQSADSRSLFLEAFHNLLYRTTLYYKQSDDTTMIADGFPVLNALREVHLLLAQGAHNQYGDLPWMARSEMLIQQWLLARPEMREFLQTRAMVPYKEAWMPAVDAMKTMQGWTDISVTHFHDLAEYGEQILLSIRLGDWVDVNDPQSAANWAAYWRPEIQGYIHAYRVATGVDLTLEPRQGQQAKLWATQPAILLQQRLAAPTPTPLLPGKTPEPLGFRQRREARRP